MENSSLQCLKQFEVPYKCDQCEKEQKRKSSFTRHCLTNHEPIELLKLQLKWELGITNGIVYRPNQIVEKTNFDLRTDTSNPRTFYYPAIWNPKPKQ